MVHNGLESSKVRVPQGKNFFVGVLFCVGGFGGLGEKSARARGKVLKNWYKIARKIPTLMLH